MGDMLLAVNKDVTLESTYDEVSLQKCCININLKYVFAQVVPLLKRAEGIVNLVLLTLKSEEAIKKEREEAEKAKEKPKEPEKPADPATDQIVPNKKMIIEIKVEKKPLGVIVCGGKNNYVKVSILLVAIVVD